MQIVVSESQCYQANICCKPIDSKLLCTQAPPVPEKEWLGEEWRDQACFPMHKWQLPEYGPSSCNSLHESSDSNMQFIDCGGSRCAFHIQDSEEEYVVLKTPK